MTCKSQSIYLYEVILGRLTKECLPDTQRCKLFRAEQINNQRKSYLSERTFTQNHQEIKITSPNNILLPHIMRNIFIGCRNTRLRNRRFL